MSDCGIPARPVPVELRLTTSSAGRSCCPQCAINILFAIYQYAVAATMQLTFLESKQDLHLDQSTENAVISGKVTACNTTLTDPDAFSTLFARTTYDYQTIF